MQTAEHGARYLSRELVEQLGGKIVRGDVPAGDSLPIEAELSKQFGASRTIVREAVKMLTAKGLVGSRPRRGTYVEPVAKWNILDPDVLRWTLQCRFSLKLMREFLVARRAIEPAAAREAAVLADPARVERIGACLQGMREAAEGDRDPLEADIAFHLAILEASGNRFFQQFSYFVDTALRFSIRLTNTAKGVHAADVEDHAAIYEAIARGNGREARKASEYLLDEALDLLDSLAAEKQHGTAPRPLSS
jgi:DNA-binding FadR family transcriptional regulator